MMQIRKAQREDLDRMMEIYAYARAFMAEHGNPLQWGPTCWPPRELIEKDIKEGKSYLCTEGDRIIGVFYYDYGEDIEPLYRDIEGAWQKEGPYGVVHRIAGDGSEKGIGSFCLGWAFSQCGHLRMDTHGDNKVMQSLLTKLGFVHCGTVHVEEDPYPRLAYEKWE